MGTVVMTLLRFRLLICRTGSLYATSGTMHHGRQGLLLREKGDAVPVQLQYWDGGGKNRKAEKQAPDQAAILGIFQISASFIFRGMCSNLVEVSSGFMYRA